MDTPATLKPNQRLTPGISGERALLARLQGDAAVAAVGDAAVS
jgi:hypothetical protein